MLAVATVVVNNSERPPELKLVTVPEPGDADCNAFIAASIVDQLESNSFEDNGVELPLLFTKLIAIPVIVLNVPRWKRSVKRV